MGNDKFRVLRRELKNHGVDIPYLAELCGVSFTTIYATLRGEREWPLEWMYITMDALALPYSNMPMLFPRNGMYAGELGHKTLTADDKFCMAIKEYVKEYVKEVAK